MFASFIYKNRKKKDYEQYLVSKEYFQLNKLLFKVFPGLFIFQIFFTNKTWKMK